MSALSGDDFKELYNNYKSYGLDDSTAKKFSFYETAATSSDSNVIKTLEAISAGAKNAAASVDASSGAIVKSFAAIGGGAKGLWASLSAFGKFAVITAAAYGAYKIAYNVVNAGEIAKSKMNDAISEYDENKSKLDSVNSQLEATKKSINELQVKGGLTFVEKEQLDNLRETTRQLTLQKKILDGNNETAAHEVAKKTHNALYKNYSDLPISEDTVKSQRVKNYVQEEFDEDGNSLGGGYWKYTPNGNISASLAKLQDLQNRQNEISVDSAEWKTNETAIANLKENIYSAISEWQEMKSALEVVPKSSRTKQEQGDIEALNSAIKTATKIVDPATWKQMELDDFLSSDAISKQKQQLIEKAKANKYKGIGASDLSKPLIAAAADAGIRDINDIINAINSEAGVFNVEEAKKQIKEGFQNSSFFKDSVKSDQGKFTDQFNKFVDGLAPEDVELAYKLSLDVDSSEWSPEVWKQRLADLKSGADVAISEFKDDVSTAIEQQSKLTSAFAAGNSATGMTYDQIQEVCNAFKKLEGFDMASLFERTATGVQMNADAFKKYNEALQADTQLELLTALEAKQKKYNEAIQNFKNTGEDKYSSLADSYAKDIEQLALLINELEAASSKYNAFVTASSGANRRDSYTNVSAGYKSVKELLNQGWVSDDSVTSYLDLVLGDGWQEKTKNNAKKAFRLISSPYETEAGRFTGHSLKSYLEADGSGNVTSRGAWTFAEDLVKLQKGGIFGDQNIATKDADGLITLDLTGDKLQTVADKLGTTTDMVDLLGKALSDAGMSVTFDDASKKVENLKTKTEELKAKQSQLTKGTEEYGEVQGQIDRNSKTVAKVTVQSALEDGQTLEELDSMDGKTIQEKFDLDASQAEAVIAEVDERIKANKEAEITVKLDSDQLSQLLGLEDLEVDVNPEVKEEPKIPDGKMNVLAEVTNNPPEIKDGKMNVTISPMSSTSDGGSADPFEKVRTKAEQLSQELNAMLGDGIKIPIGLDTSRLRLTTLEEQLAKIAALVEDYNNRLKLKIKVENPDDPNFTEPPDGENLDNSGLSSKVTTVKTEVETPNIETPEIESPEITASLTVDPNPPEVEPPEIEPVTINAEVNVDPNPPEIEDGQMNVEAVVTNNPPSIDGGTVDGEGTAPTGGAAPTGGTVPAITGVANYTLGTTPTTAPPINGVANYTGDFSGVGSPPTLSGTVVYHAVFTGGGGGGRAAGTMTSMAMADGTAYNVLNYKRLSPSHAGGDVALHSDEDALTNEVGRESIVRNGMWYMLPPGPHIEHLKKGDIIFSAKQTEDLLKAGKTSTYARALSTGTVAKLNSGSTKAFWSGSGHNPWASGGSSGGSSSISEYGKLNTGKSSQDKQDWVEIALKRVEDLISKLTDVVSSSFKKVETKLSSSNDAIENTIQQIENEQIAYKTYLRAANAVGLHEGLAEQVRDGNLYNIKSYDEDDTKKIKEYKEWYEKALECEAEIDKLHESLAELYKGQFDNVQKDFENQLSVLESSAKKTESEISKVEAKGYVVSAKYYEKQKQEQSETIDLLKKQLVEMQSYFEKAMGSGGIDKNSEAYYEMVNAIEDVKDKISDAELEIINLNKSIRELNWDSFDMMLNCIELINDEAEFMIGLLEDAKFYDDNGSLNENGEAALGLYLQRYNTYLAESEKYAEEIKKIQAEIEKDPYNQDLIDRKNDLIKSQQDSIKSAIDEKEAIQDLINDGIDEETDHLDDLIDKYEDALDAQKDLYEYSNKLKDQTSDISKLRKQILAYKDNTSKDAKAKVQKWEVDLKKAEQELQETQYDQFISDQKKMLSDMVDDYKEAMNDRTDNIDSLISDLTGTVNENASKIYETIKGIADKYGYSISDETTGVWSSGSDKVVTGYEEKVSGSLSSIDKMVSNIGKDIGTMIKQLNEVAGTNLDSIGSYATGSRRIASSQLAWTQENGIKEAIIRASDGAMLTKLNSGDAVFNGNATDNLWNMANDPSGFIYSHLVHGYSPIQSSSGTTANNTTQIGDVQFVLPNVKNYDEFLAEMQKDRKFEKMVQAMTLGVATGKSSFDKYNI